MNIRKISRFLSPRIFIYSILAIALAWLMHQHSRIQDRKRREAEQMVNACAMQNAVKPYDKDMPLKKAELKNSRPGECTLPMMLLLTEDTQTDTLFQTLRDRYSSQLSVVRVNCRKDRSSLSYFKAEKLPALILYSRSNQELGRLEGKLDLAAAEEMIRKHLSRQTSPSPAP